MILVNAFPGHRFRGEDGQPLRPSHQRLKGSFPPVRVEHSILVQDRLKRFLRLPPHRLQLGAEHFLGETLRGLTTLSGALPEPSFFIRREFYLDRHRTGPSLLKNAST